MSAPGWLTGAERRVALAAPASAGGFSSAWVEVAGLATHYRAGGPVGGASGGPAGGAAKAGLPIVLVHGLAVSHRYLMPTAVALAAHHPVYVPDLPGFGLTGKPRRAYSVAEHARHLDGWLAALGLAGVCALGHSFGAEVVAALAAAYPGRVSALVLGGPTSDPAARSRRAQVARFVWNLAGEDPRQALILARDVRDAGPRRVWATVGHSVRNAIERDVAAAGVPTLVFGGVRDRVSVLPWRTRLAALAGGAQVSVPGAAHNAATTAGPQVAGAVTGFLDLTVCPGSL